MNANAQQTSDRFARTSSGSTTALGQALSLAQQQKVEKDKSATAIGRLSACEKQIGALRAREQQLAADFERIKHDQASVNAERLGLEATLPELQAAAQIEIDAKDQSHAELMANRKKLADPLTGQAQSFELRAARKDSLIIRLQTEPGFENDADAKEQVTDAIEEAATFREQAAVLKTRAEAIMATGKDPALVQLVPDNKTGGKQGKGKSEPTPKPEPVNPLTFREDEDLLIAELTLANGAKIVFVASDSLAPNDIFHTCRSADVVVGILDSKKGSDYVNVGVQHTPRVVTDLANFDRILKGGYGTAYPVVTKAGSRSDTEVAQGYINDVPLLDGGKVKVSLRGVITSISSLFSLR